MRAARWAREGGRANLRGAGLGVARGALACLAGFVGSEGPLLVVTGASGPGLWRMRRLTSSSSSSNGADSCWPAARALPAAQLRQLGVLEGCGVGPTHRPEFGFAAVGRRWRVAACGTSPRVPRSAGVPRGSSDLTTPASLPASPPTPTPATTNNQRTVPGGVHLDFRRQRPQEPHGRAGRAPRRRCRPAAR
jgi:hypothetical protein